MPTPLTSEEVIARIHCVRPDIPKPAIAAALLWLRQYGAMYDIDLARIQFMAETLLRLSKNLAKELAAS